MTVIERDVGDVSRFLQLFSESLPVYGSRSNPLTLTHSIHFSPLPSYLTLHIHSPSLLHWVCGIWVLFPDRSVVSVYLRPKQSFFISTDNPLFEDQMRHWFDSHGHEVNVLMVPDIGTRANRCACRCFSVHVSVQRTIDAVLCRTCVPSVRDSFLVAELIFAVAILTFSGHRASSFAGCGVQRTTDATPCPTRAGDPLLRRAAPLRARPRISLPPPPFGPTSSTHRARTQHQRGERQTVKITSWRRRCKRRRRRSSGA